MPASPRIQTEGTSVDAIAAEVGDVLTLSSDLEPEWQPPTGGGLPTGWSQDDSDPANVDTHGAGLICAFSEDPYSAVQFGGQINGQPNALDANNRPIQNVNRIITINFPTEDPGDGSSLWCDLTDGRRIKLSLGD